MGRTRHEVSCVRKGRDHPAGRAIASTAKRTLDKLGNPRATFYRWYDRCREGGIEALADHRSRPDRVWNRITEDVRGHIVDWRRERYGKGIARFQVWNRKASTSELPFKCRKWSNDTETGE
jgi:hypothetical protein